MDNKKAVHGPYHRKGNPGGPGCEVAILPVVLKGRNGDPMRANLFDAGGASEAELLRTVAYSLNIKWGHDELGWWAAVPCDSIELQFAPPSDAAMTWRPPNAGT